MKVILINAVPYGSTGKIMFSVSKLVQRNGGKTVAATGFSWHKVSHEEHKFIGNLFTKSLHMFLSKLCGNHGCYSSFSTMQLIKRIKEFSPDIIHLHNIHGWYLNIPMLFNYLKKCNIPIIWTLHDCWAFTGGCAHFTFSRCDKWLRGCGECDNLKDYPILSKVDRTQKMWHIKSECFCDLPNLTLITPSLWLARLVKESFLNKYPIQVINNGIDLDVFKPNNSTLADKYGVYKENYIVLGVSLGWNERKGLDVFVELFKRLPKEYTIVLVGTDERVDKLLPAGIVSIHRTQNQQELAEIYSYADVFVNPTREENFPTVNIESLACGTPVITFNTGGSPEIIDKTCGSVVEYDNIDALEKEIIYVCTTKPYSKESCIKKAKDFDERERFKEYLNLYETIIAKGN